MEIVQFMNDLMISDYYDKNRVEALKEYMSMKIYTHKFFPTTTDNEIIAQEWANDEVSFVTFLDNKIYEKITHPDDTPFSLDGDYKKEYKRNAKAYEPFKNVAEQYKEYQEVGDITMCESISLADKMAYFD